MKSFLLDYNETNTFSRKDLGHTRVLIIVVEKHIYWQNSRIYYA